MRQYQKKSDHWQKFASPETILQEYTKNNKFVQIAKEHHIGENRIRNTLRIAGVL